MADEADTPEDDELLLDDPVEEPDDEPNPEVNDAADEEEVLTFGDDLPPEQPDESNVIKAMRQRLKDKDKELAELRKSAPQQQAIEVGEKPTLEACEYDEEAFDREYEAWRQRKAAAERQQSEASQQSEQAAKAWEAEKQRYTTGKAALGYADVDDAEETVTAALGENLAGALIMATENPARVTYALYKHPEKLAELAAHASNPIKFIAAVAKLEGQLKVVKKRKAAEPEQIERGSGSIASTRTDKQLEKLEKEAERTGDRTAVVAYKKKLKAK